MCSSDLTDILTSSNTPDEKLAQIAQTFKAIGGTVGVAALISSMLLYLTVPTSAKEFVQLYTAMGATQDKIKQYFTNTQYKQHFSQDEIDYVVDDWMKINQRFIKAGMKVNSIPGFSVTSKDGKAYAEYRDWETDRKSTRLNSSHITRSRMPSSA